MEYTVTIHVVADSETEVEKRLEGANWIDSYDLIDEVPQEVIDDDDDEDVD